MTEEVLCKSPYISKEVFWVKDSIEMENWDIVLKLTVVGVRDSKDGIDIVNDSYNKTDSVTVYEVGTTGLFSPYKRNKGILEVYKPYGDIYFSTKIRRGCGLVSKSKL